MVKKGDMMSTEDIISLLSVPLLGVVPESEDVVVSTNRGVPLVHERTSKAGAAFRRIASRLNGESLPQDGDGADGFFSRVKRLIWN